MSPGEIHRPCREEVERLRALVERLEKELALLRERIGRNSSNSSKPPSSDEPDVPKAPPRPRGKGRKPGGQPGHPGVTRALVPVERLARPPVDVLPDLCGGCRTPLRGYDENPVRHQILEMPNVVAQWLEWRLHRLCCVRCGAWTRADLPVGVPRNGFGPRLTALVAVLTGGYRLTKRYAVSLLSVVLKVDLAVGSITSCERHASRAVEEPYKGAVTHVQQQPIKHADESSWKEGPARQRAWLWVATTRLVTVFMIQRSRGAEVAKQLLGAVTGYLVSDRWSGYNWWPRAKRQVCWAHIKRHFQSFVDSESAEASELGRILLRHHRKLFGMWNRVRDGTLTHSSFRQYAWPIRRKIRKLLDRGEACSHGPTAGTCRELLSLESSLWTFIRNEGVPPTNNDGERAIRPGVILRKLTFGTHSTAGSRFVERMLSVIQTLKQQERNALDYMTDCIQAMWDRQPAPALTPA